MTADLAARLAVLERHNAHEKAYEAFADADENAENISDQARAALERAEAEASAAIEASGLHMMTDNAMNPFCCPLCRAPILEEDFEVEKPAP